MKPLKLKRESHPAKDVLSGARRLNKILEVDHECLVEELCELQLRIKEYPEKCDLPERAAKLEWIQKISMGLSIISYL